MVKRKCGTCRHFSDGGVAGSGWCQHPARRDLQHMVLVRKSELACRNGWDQDLWEQGALADDDGGTLTSDPPSNPNGRMPVFSAEMIPDPVGTDLGNSEIFTDKIQSIGLSRRPVEPVSPAPAQAAIGDAVPDGASHDSRSAVREARRRRQEQRSHEQRRHQRALIQEAGALLDEPEQKGTRPTAETDVSPSLVDRPRSPARAPIGHIRKSTGTASRSTATGGTNRDGDSTGTDEWIELNGTSDRFDGPGSGVRAEVPARSTVEDGGTEPLPIEEVRSKLSSSQHVEPVDESLPRARQTISLDPPIPARPTTSITGAGVVGGQPRRGTPEARLPSNAPRLPMAMQSDPVDQSPLAASIQRCCATCRDFRRVGDGSHGWCVNGHAFTERRMVESDELSCRSSIGTWWLPSDDLWLERVDMIHHGRPTPLLDEIFGDEPVDGHDHDMESRPF